MQRQGNLVTKARPAAAEPPLGDPVASEMAASVDADESAISGESGFTVAAAIWVMGVTLVLVTSFANLFVHRYAQAVIRQATDEGARAWAINGGTAADCQAAADDVVADLLGGTLAADVVIGCADNGDTIAVTATATLGALPPLPDASFATTSIVTKELRDDEIATP